jgi:hypothetical protein
MIFFSATKYDIPSLTVVSNKILAPQFSLTALHILRSFLYRTLDRAVVKALCYKVEESGLDTR